MNPVVTRIWQTGKVPLALLTLSFVEFAVAMFLFLFPGGWDIGSAAVSAAFFSVTVPRSYAVVTFVAFVNGGLYRYATDHHGGKTNV